MSRLALFGGPPAVHQPPPAWPPEPAAELLPVWPPAWDGWDLLAVADRRIALELALLAAGLGADDEVVIPTFAPVVERAASDIYAQPVAVDLEPGHWTLDPRAVEAALTPRTRAVVATCRAGHPPRLAELRRLCARRALALIVDGSDAPGTRLAEGPVALAADLGVWALPAGSETVALVAAPPGLLARATVLLGLVEDAPPEALELAGRRWAGFPAELARRAANFERLAAAVAPIDGLTLIEPAAEVAGHDPCGALLEYRAEAFDDVPRDRFLTALQAEGVSFVAGLQRPGAEFSGAPTRRGATPQAQRAQLSDLITVPPAWLLADETLFEQLAFALHRVHRHRDELRL